MEVWGGIECTINRVGGQYLNQLEYQGHYDREIDLDLIAGLGIKKLRYPVLWEHHCPDNNVPDWKKTGERLNFFRNKGIEVIAGLVHHGAGPGYVNILNETFTEGLADYARKVAAQFPWINYYTPVNEPLTTARFSGLYGIWYPHHKSEKSFLRILVNECRATILAMKAIREINPSAMLVHTEDLSFVHSTPALKYQADFENQRRWMGIDLLCGKVSGQHLLRPYLLKNGIAPAELDFFIENSMNPDILGFNHYLTSERYIDENVECFPAHTHGGNGKDIYADVEAIRTSNVTAAGPKKLLKEAWDRYGIPLAVTETHLSCGREHQLRWMNCMVRAATELEKEGIPIKGVTAWSLFGAFGWDKLLTIPGGRYETGAFDLRSEMPRPTALAAMIKGLAKGVDTAHPVVQGAGWWERDQRVIYPEILICSDEDCSKARCRPVLILGASGTLGRAFARICRERNINYISLTRDALDICKQTDINRAINAYKPWAIINATGYVRVDEAESDQETCFSANSTGPANLASACYNAGIKLATFSTDLVFNGNKASPYTENDKPDPLNTYGLSKALGEKKAMQANPDALIIRTSTFFGPWDSYNFASCFLSSFNLKKPVHVASDIYISPTYVPDLVHTAIDLLIDDEKGMWHLVNDGKITWAALAKEIAERGGYDAGLVIPVPSASISCQAKRPLNSALSSKRGSCMPTLTSALDRYFKEAISLAMAEVR